MVGAKFPSDFVLVAVLALLCCYCGGKVNKRPNFIKTAAMLELEDEEKRQKREEELLKKLLTKRKAKNKKKEKFKDKIRRLYNEKREKIHKYFEATKKKKKTPQPPSIPPPGFSGVVPAVSYTLVEIQKESEMEAKTKKKKKKRVASL